jgi:hypothetical protein
MHSTGLSLLTELAGLTKIDEPEARLDSVRANIPVISAVSVAMKMAEIRADLSRTLGLPSASRFGIYQLARDVIDENLIKTMVQSFG